MDAATLDEAGLWVTGGGLAFFVVSILARTWTADEGRYEEEQAALKALADARNTGMSRHGPTSSPTRSRTPGSR